MTEEATKKIGSMYDRFGISSEKDAICKNCSHLSSYEANRKYYKCECYGNSSSEATDWRIGWIACGLYNREYKGVPVIDMKKHSGRKKPEIQVEGQLTLF